MIVPAPGVSRLLAQVSLGTGVTEIYQAPSSPPNLFVRITGLWLCNSDTSYRALTLRFGLGVLTAANNLQGASQIQPNTTYIAFEGNPIDIEASYHFNGFCDVADKFTVTAFGYLWKGS